MVTREELAYYHSEQEYLGHDALGTILLKNIGSVLPSQRAEAAGLGFEFVVSASDWQKRGVSMGHREFYFMASSEEERDDWITTIDLLKAVAVQRDFQSAFGAKLMVPTKADPPVTELFDMSRSVNRKAIVMAPERDTRRARTLRHSVSQMPEDFGVMRTAKELKENVKGLFNYMFAHFAGHVMEHSFKSEMKVLRQTPGLITGLFDQIGAKCAMVTDLRAGAGGDSPATPRLELAVANSFHDLVLDLNTSIRSNKSRGRLSVCNRRSPSIDAVAPCALTPNQSPAKENLNLEESLLPVESIPVPQMREDLERNRKDEGEKKDEEVSGEVDDTVVKSDSESSEPEGVKVNKTSAPPSNSSSPGPEEILDSAKRLSPPAAKLKRKIEVKKCQEVDEAEEDSKGFVYATPEERKHQKPKAMSELKSHYSAGKEGDFDQIFDRRYTTKSNGLATRSHAQESPQTAPRRRELSIAELQHIRSETANSARRTRKEEPRSSAADRIITELRRILDEKLAYTSVHRSSADGDRAQESSPPYRRAISYIPERVDTDRTDLNKETKPRVDNPVLTNLKDENTLNLTGSELEGDAPGGDTFGMTSAGMIIVGKRYGFVKKTVASIGGDLFELKENSIVVVEKIDEEDNIATCSYKDMVGIFPLDAIKVGSAIESP